MPKVRVGCILFLIFLLAACSGKGRFGPGGDGNIPIAEPGRELADIHFDFDSYQIRQSEQAAIQRNGRWLLDNPDKKVVVEGHCDARGTNEYNMALGELRARMVRNFLVGMGVDKDQLSTISYGEELPLVNESTPAAWAKNRRVHFSIR